MADAARLEYWSTPTITETAENFAQARSLIRRAEYRLAWIAISVDPVQQTTIKLSRAVALTLVDQQERRAEPLPRMELRDGCLFIGVQPYTVLRCTPRARTHG